MAYDFHSKFRRIIIIAGPNGAGKTISARMLPLEADCPDFINMDLIAAGLSPFKPKKRPYAQDVILPRKFANELSRKIVLPLRPHLAGEITHSQFLNGTQ